MYLDTEEALEAAFSLVVGTTGISFATLGEDCISFPYKGLTYTFYDFVDLIEFTSKIATKNAKATRKEVKTLRKQAHSQAKIITALNKKSC